MLTLQQVPTPCAAKGSLLNCQTCLYHRRRVWGWQSQFRDGRNSLQRNTAVTTPRYQHNTNEMPQRLPTFKTVATGTGSLICSPEHEHNATFAAQTTARRADNASSVMTMRIGGQAGLHTSKSCVSGAFRTPVCGAVRSSTRSRMPLLVQAAGKTRVVRGKCYVTRDVSVPSGRRLCVRVSCLIHQINDVTLVQNIDTDQIIPAEYLTLVPSKV